MTIARLVRTAVRSPLYAASIALAALAIPPLPAAAQSPGALSIPRESRDGPDLYFKQNPACLVGPNCQIPASSVYPNPNDYTTLATLNLPEGSYLVTSKLSAFSQNASGYFNFECALLDVAGNTALDYSSFDGFFGSTLFLQTPLTFKKHGGGAVRIGCRVYGINADGSLTDMHVWNVDIAAISVGRVKMHYQ